METKKVAIACQGGGLHGAFTYGVLRRILEHKDNEEKGVLQPAAQQRFEIRGLSGTSAGALNAFMTWYGLLLKKDQTGGFTEAIEALDRLWTEFPARKTGEFSINSLAQQLFALQGIGIGLQNPAPPIFYDWLMTTLSAWHDLEDKVSRNTMLPGVDLDLLEVRKEFYSFEELLKTCAPHFDIVDAEQDQIAADQVEPRLLVGAVEILSGRFEAFDSFQSEKKKRISLEAVQASGTLPEIRRSQRIPGLKHEDGRDCLYWDGLWSQNPPIKQFFTDLTKDKKPDEIWVIRINPQERDSEPEFLGAIEDRRNELSGNLSLNQELRFIERVDDWLDKYPDFHSDYKPVQVYTISMSEEESKHLDVASKFNRSPEFTERMKSHGEEQGEKFLDLWLKDSDVLKELPYNAFKGID